jgi:hypothetical protein
MRYEDLSEEDQQRFDDCGVIIMIIPHAYSDEQVKPSVERAEVHLSLQRFCLM